MQKRKKKRKLTPRFFGILALAGMLIVLSMTFLLVRLIFVYVKSRDEYKQMANEAIATVSPAPSVETNNPPVTTASALTQPEEPTPEPVSIPITIDWSNLRATNKQIIAWIYCEGTDINYPIVQTKNNTYYLTHNAKRKEDQAGALFLDYRNHLGGELENLIVYGHRMKDGSMFGSLWKFAEKSYRDEHEAFYFFTPDQAYRVEVFSCRTVNSHTKYFPSSFTSLEAEKKYTDKALSQSYWQQAPENKPEGALLLTLSTCSKYDFSEDSRLLVHGWAVPINVSKDPQ